VVYIRDNYCSCSMKAFDLWAPTDLVYQSGYLAQQFDVTVLDGQAERLRPEQCVREVTRRRPALILFITGEACWAHDLKQVAAIRRRLPNAQIVATGDFALAAARPFLEAVPWVDAVLLNLFTDGILRYAAARRAGRPREPIADITYRTGDRIIEGTREEPRLINVPLPRYELFPYRKYHLLAGGSRQAATALSSIGCRFTCPFCSASIIRLQLRPIDEVVGELTMLWDLGVRHVHFFDADFLSSRERVRDLSGAIRKALPGLTWSCQAHVTGLTEESVRAMRAGGCRAVFVGLESGSDETLKRIGKGITTADATRTVERCHRHGLIVLGFVIIGLPQETEQQMRRTMQYVKDLDLEYASFNVPCPIPGTRMHAECGLGVSPDTNWDHTYSPAIRHPTLSAARIRHLRREAFRSFYLRPGYVWRLMVRCLRTEGLAAIVRSGLVAFRSYTGLG